MRFTTSCNSNLGYVFVNGNEYLQFDTEGTLNLCLFYNFGLFGVNFCRSFLRPFGGKRPLAERILNFLL